MVSVSDFVFIRTGDAGIELVSNEKLFPAYTVLYIQIAIIKKNNR